MAKPRNLIEISLFVASGAETIAIRDKLCTELEKLNDVNKRAGFQFKLLRWENASTAVPASQRSQDIYNAEIDECDMLAVIIKDHLGAYTTEEFEYALKIFQQNKRHPRICVYTFNSGADDDARHEFITKLRPGRYKCADELQADGGIDYFRTPIATDDGLMLEISRELLRIKEDYAAEQKAAIESAEETIQRFAPGSGLTKQAVELFEKGDYAAAADAIDLVALRKQAEELLPALQELADAFVLKAKLELADVDNKDRFASAKGLFEEALRLSHDPEILFEYAYYCQNQNDFGLAERLYEEALELCCKLAAQNPAAYEPGVATTLNNLANLHAGTNEYLKAEAEYEEALELYCKLAAQNPAAYESYVVGTLNNLAVLHSKTNEYQKAEAEYEEALDLSHKLAAQNPAVRMLYVTMTLNNLGSLHSHTDEYAKAEAEYEEALDLRRKLAAQNPAYAPLMAHTLSNLANLHANTNEYPKAKVEYGEALGLHRKLAAKIPAVYGPFLDLVQKNYEEFLKQKGE